ncbi:MAG: hydantoinase B/oxoprolinase family protein [Thermodesulfobacteriota bacterium]|nr:hydantoinase B/oxoprolinase family protein [Thermodesulfobacteriota bacterium]
MNYKADAVTMQVIRYGLEAVADDMGYNLMRMGRSTIVKEIMDINCGVLDANGDILSQAHLCPLMMFSLPTTAVNMLERVKKFDEGDVIICNDPYLGGQHLLDVQFFSPVFVGRELVAFVANIAHQLDMGGAVPGGVAGGLTEIYQEGLRIPFVKLYCKGEEDQQIFDIISSNIRVPEKTMEDLRAQAATTMVGVKRVKALVNKYGLDIFRKCTDMLMDYSENVVRRFLTSLPDGDYTGLDYLDDDGYEDKPVKVQVNIHIKGDSMQVDFDGSDSQTTGNVNSPWACTQGGVFYTMVGIIDPDMALNSGAFRPIEVRSAKGLVTNPLPPAGVTARSQTMTKIVEAMLKAMSEIVPDRVVAGSHGQACTNSFSGIHPETGKRFTYLEIQGGGAGARPGKDGPDGQDLHLGRFMNTPVEAAELENPVMIERYEFLPDSGGPGKYRGGLSLRRDIRFLTDVTWARYSDRQKFKPLGLFGGMEGSMGSLTLNPETPEQKKCKSKGVDQIKAGDLLSICLPGSGGYGLPRERDPEAVRWDVVNGKISMESARKDYGVVLDDEMGLDMKATETLRNEIR